MIKAAIYLRVSTIDQARKGNTHRDGFSIPAQREACRKKAEMLGVRTIKEYVDRGESARSANRPALQQMLEDIKEKKKFDYVIVHKLDRLARSIHDDVMIGLAIERGGAQLVSVTENIDETPSGRLLHGIMATIAEFYSRNLALEAIKGSTEKAKQGGTPFQAPIGYLNITERHQHRENRTIILDPERAQLVTWAFERYATGDYSEKQLLEDLIERGLRSNFRHYSRDKAISHSGLDRMLSNRYYLGFVSYCGVEYKGNHQPLVTPSVFAAVQLVRKAHSRKLRKQRRHFHPLSRLLVCGRCGRTLCYALAKHRFQYFFCLNRHNGCGQPYIPAQLIEEAVMKIFTERLLSEPERAELEGLIKQELSGEVSVANTELDRQLKRVARLKAEQEQLLQAYYGELIQSHVLKREQKRLIKELNQAKTVINQAEARVRVIQNRRERALEVARGLNLGTVYDRANPIIQKHFCQALLLSVKLDDRPTQSLEKYWWLKKHEVAITEVKWSTPINIHHLTEAILSLALKG